MATIAILVLWLMSLGVYNVSKAENVQPATHIPMNYSTSPLIISGKYVGVVRFVVMFSNFYRLDFD